MTTLRLNCDHRKHLIPKLILIHTFSKVPTFGAEMMKMIIIDDRDDRDDDDGDDRQYHF